MHKNTLKLTNYPAKLTYSPKHEAPSFSDVMKTNIWYIITPKQNKKVIQRKLSD